MKNYKIEVFLSAENESDLIERIEDIDKDNELNGYGKITLVQKNGKEVL